LIIVRRPHRTLFRMAKEASKKKESKASSEEQEVAAPATRPPKPDEVAFKARLDEVQGEVNGLREKMKKLSEKIDAVSGGKEEFDTAKSALFEKINEVKAKQSALIEAKKQLRDQDREAKQNERDAQRKERDLEKEAGAMSEESIQVKITQLEYQMSTQSIPLKKEKEMMMQIKQLRKKIPEAQRVHKELEALKAGKDNPKAVTDASKPVKEQLADYDAELDKVKEILDAEYGSLNKLKEQREKKYGGVKGFIEEKKKLKTQVDALIEKREAIWAEKKGMQKLWYAFEKQERAKKEAEWKAEQAKRDAEWAAEKAKRELEKPNPYLEAITLREQTLEYCRNQMPKVEVVEEEKVEVEHKNEGARILVSKKDRDADMWFGGTKTKNLKKKGTKKTAAIKHTAATLAIFDKLKLKAPQTQEDLVPLCEALEKQLGEYAAKTKNWEEERAKKVAAMEAGEDADEAGDEGATVEEAKEEVAAEE